MSWLAMVITYLYSGLFHGLGNMRNSHTTFPISLRHMELFMKPAIFPFITFPSIACPQTVQSYSIQQLRIVSNTTYHKGCSLRQIDRILVTIGLNLCGIPFNYKLSYAQELKS